MTQHVRGQQLDILVHHVIAVVEPGVGARAAILFELENVKLRFEQDALHAIAEEAHRRKSGARGLRSILEEVMLDVMYEIPSLTDVKECVVTRAVVENRERPELVLDSKEGVAS